MSDERFFERGIFTWSNTGDAASADDAVSTLPDPVSSRSVQEIAESIVRAANEGEEDPVVMRVMALMALQLKG